MCHNQPLEKLNKHGHDCDRAVVVETRHKRISRKKKKEKKGGKNSIYN